MAHPRDPAPRAPGRGGPGPRSRCREGFRLAVLLASLIGGCDGNRPTAPPSPIPSAPAGATPGASSGPTRIALVAADPVAGSTITGCGSAAGGCAGRVRMTFLLSPTASGAVLWSAGFLHAADKTSCLQGRTAGFPLRAGEARTVEVVFDLSAGGDRCRTPVDVTDLALTVEGTGDVASRQEWALRYRLSP